MKNRVVVGLVVLAVLIILASLLSPTRGFDLLSQKDIAILTEVNAETPQSVITRGLDQYEDLPAKKGTLLRHLDIIKTNPLSDTLVQFKGIQGEFRVLENSEVLLEFEDDKHLLVTVRSGDIFIEKFGKEPSFWVRKDGRQLTAVDYALSNDKNAEVLRAKGQKINTVTGQGLSQAQIEEVLASKKSDFFRCYGQLIQKKEQAHGQVLISFEISPLGKVSKVEITRTDIEESSFKSCLAEVVARTTFPQFSGSNITTVFPVKFD